MGLPSDLEAVEVVARRIDFLEHLRDHPSHKPSLVEALDHSRSTVDRAVDSLESEGLIERRDAGYVTTQSGEFLARRYRSFLNDAVEVVDGQAVLDAIPPDRDLPDELLAEASIELAEGPYGVFASVADPTAAVDRYRVVLPRLVDSRHVRLWHSQVVRRDVDVEVLAAPSLLDRLREEFPELTNDLVDADGFTAVSVDAPPYGLVLTGTADDPSDAGDDPPDSAFLVTYEADGVAGAITAPSQSGIDWVHRKYERLKRGGETATDQLRSPSARHDLSTLTGARLPPALRSEGFVRVDEEFFRGSDALSPDTAWRAGLGLPEVAAGHAVERQLPDGTPLTDAVLDGLDDGDVALIGPAGAGKSTVCKSVACRWYDERNGAVLYREWDAGSPFQSTAVLERVLRRASGPTLVVVEDAVRAATEGVFEVMRSLSGREDVAFLLDARNDEWHSPGDSGLDARLDAFRRESVEVMPMPPVGEDDCRQLLSEAEAVLDTALDVEPDRLLEEIESADTDAGMPGSMLLLGHRVARHANPLAEYNGGGPTTLDDDVDSVRTDLADVGDVALDVGVLANALNAGGVELHPELLYVTGLDRSDAAGPDPAVEAAVDRLEGHVLFEGSGSKRYRGIHESWSTRFLERVLEAEGERAAERRVGRCLSALFALADDPDRCDRLARLIGGRTPGLDRIVAEPTDWADDVVESVFELGRSNANLAPLFGTTESSSIRLPSACSPETEFLCLQFRGRMWKIAGDLDRAADEYRELATRATEHGDRSTEADAIRRLGKIAQKRGDYGRARDQLETALDIAREVDDRSVEARTRKSLGDVADLEGDFDRAVEHFETALAIAGEIDDRKVESACLNNLGLVTKRQGEIEHAREYYEESLAIDRALGDRRGEAVILQNLGSLAYNRGEYDRARTHFEKGLSIRRELGDVEGEASGLNNLGLIYEKQGEYDRAREYYARSLELKRDIGNRNRWVATLNNLGNVARLQGEYDRAEEHLDESLAVAREIGSRHGEGRALVSRGELAVRRSNHDAADEYFEEARAIANDLGSPDLELAARQGIGTVARERGEYDRADEALSAVLERKDPDEYPETVADAHLERARLALATGDLDAADEYATNAEETAERTEVPHLQGRVRLVRGAVAAETDSLDAARDHWAAALDRFEAVGAPQDALRALERLVEACQDAGDEARAREWLDRGREVLADAPAPVVDRHEEWVQDRTAPRDEEPADAGT